MNRVCQFHIALYFSPKIQLAKFSELLRTSGIRSLPTFSISTEHDRTVDFHRTLFQQLWEQVLIFGTFPRISFSSLFRLRFFPSSLLDFHSLSGLYLGLFVRSTQAIYLFSSCLARRDASPSTLPPRRFLFRSSPFAHGFHCDSILPFSRMYLADAIYLAIFLIWRVSRAWGWYRGTWFFLSKSE